MGKFDFDMPIDLVKQLEKLDNFDEIASELLIEATPILENTVKNEIRRQSDLGTGDTADHVKGSKLKNKFGHFVTVYPRGKNKQGVRRMDIMAWLEFGTKFRSPRPIISKALKDAEPAVKELMQKKFEEVTK